MVIFVNYKTSKVPSQRLFIFISFRRFPPFLSEWRRWQCLRFFGRRQKRTAKIRFTRRNTQITTPSNNYLYSRLQLLLKYLQTKYSNWAIYNSLFALYRPTRIIIMLQWQSQDSGMDGEPTLSQDILLSKSKHIVAFYQLWAILIPLADFRFFHIFKFIHIISQLSL